MLYLTIGRQGGTVQTDGVEEVDFIRHLRIFPFSLSEEEFEACEYRTGDRGRYRVRYVTHPDFAIDLDYK